MATNEASLPQDQQLTIIPQGIKRHQHDLNCQDVGCEEIINMRYKDGSWRTVGEKHPVFGYDHGCSTLYYHAYVNEKNGTNLYVGAYGTHAAYLIDFDNSTRSSIKSFPYDIFQSFASLNSILIITTDKNEYLFQWDNDTSAYVELAKEISPDVHFKSIYAFDANGFAEVVSVLTSEDILTQADLFDQILIKKYKKRQKGLFCQAWVMIQWAFRLWDGSYIRHSQPVLLQMGTDGYYTQVVDGGTPTNEKFACTLACNIPGLYIKMTDDVRANLAKYKGMITDLCVFMSQDVSKYLFEYNSTPYQTTDDLRYFAFSDNTDSLHQLINLYPYYLAKEIKYQEIMDSTETTWFPILLNESINKLNFSGNGGDNIDTVEKIPVRHNTYSWKRFGSWVARIVNPDNNPSSWTTMEDAEQTVESTDEAGTFILQAQPELPVDDFSNHTLIGRAVPYIYNAKLHKGDINVRFGDAPQYTDWQDYSGYASEPIPATWHFYREVKITTDIGDRYVVEQFTPYLYLHTSNGYYLLRIPPIISYPDARATRIRIIAKEDGDANYYEMMAGDLKSHKIYNYAFYVTHETTTGSDPEYLLFDFYNILFKDLTVTYFPRVCGSSGVDALATDDRYYLDKNRVQVSNINNALYYPSKYSYQLGNSETQILAFASQSAPISPGQFGQFPLTLFTSQGIYLMAQGNGEVIYSAIVALNNEVAYKHSICELGGVVAYASRDGVKLLAGNRLQHISRDVEGEPSDKLINDNYYINFIQNTDGQLVELYYCLSAENFLTYLDENVRICYDKMNQELIVTNKELFTEEEGYSNPYSYVYNLPYKTWHKITDSWHQFLLVNSRWYGFKNFRSGYQTDLSVEDMTVEDSVLMDCLIQSRPMKWGTYDFKKMKTIVQRSLCYVGDPIDSSQDADDKFGLYLFASLENNIWKFIKGIKVSQTFGMIQSPTLPGTHQSVRNLVLLTAVKSRDFIFSHWEILYEHTQPQTIGVQARKNTEQLLGSYDADQYSESYDIGDYTESLP